MSKKTNNELLDKGLQAVVMAGGFALGGYSKVGVQKLAQSLVPSLLQNRAFEWVLRCSPVIFGGVALYFAMNQKNGKMKEIVTGVGLGLTVNGAVSIAQMVFGSNVVLSGLGRVKKRLGHTKRSVLLPPNHYRKGKPIKRRVSTTPTVTTQQNYF